jgi:hypothetical protein
MSLYYPTPETPIAPSVLVRKERRLPVAGDVLVRVGSRVEPDDTVAQALLPDPPITLNLAQLLGTRPKGLTRRLAKPIGANLDEGDVIISRRRGLRAVPVKSPVAGTLRSYDEATGEAVIQPGGTMFSLPAHIKGLVTEHIPYRGVVIETPAAVVRGILGFGGEQHGVLKVAVSDENEELLPDQIDPRLTYASVLGGSTTTAAALQKAVENGVRAIIIGSIQEAELRAFLGYLEGLHGWSLGRTGWMFPPPVPAATPPPPPKLTLIVTEGFGRVPMTRRAFELLAAYDSQEVAVDGTTRLRNGLTRPEVIVPLSRATTVRPASKTPPPVAVGSTVRLLDSSHLGTVTKVVALAQGRQQVDSGLNVPAAQVSLPDSGGRLWVPLVNLEVLE